MTRQDVGLPHPGEVLDIIVGFEISIWRSGRSHRRPGGGQSKLSDKNSTDMISHLSEV